MTCDKKKTIKHEYSETSASMPTSKDCVKKEDPADFHSVPDLPVVAVDQAPAHCMSLPQSMVSHRLSAKKKHRFTSIVTAKNIKKTLHYYFV